MAQIDDLTLELGDAVLLKFTAPDGAAAALDVEQLAARCDGELRAVLFAWCRDRRTRRKSRTLVERQNPLLAQDYAD